MITLRTAVSLAFLSLSPLSAQGDAAPAALCQAIGPAVQGTLAAGAAKPLPAADVLERIAALTPGTAQLATATLATATHAWPEDEDAEALLAGVPVADDSGRRVVLVASLDGQIRGGAVVGKDGQRIAAADAFVAQLAGKNVPALDRAVARKAVAERIAEFERGAVAVGTQQPAQGRAKATAALIDVRRQMAVQALPALEVLRALEQGLAPAAAHVDAARLAYQQLHGRSADLAPVLGKAAKDYSQLVANVLANLDAAVQADDAGKRQAAHKRLKGDCRDCHQLASDAFEGGFEEWAANERLRLGLGQQPFLVGYDVVAAGLDAVDAQLLADACNRAALLLDVARQ